VIPIDPPPSRWEFRAPQVSEDHDLVGIGADLEPGTILAAYKSGIFPMPINNGQEIGWWSPVSRGILPLDHLRITRSLRQSRRRFRITIDTAFDDVVSACAEPSRDGAWITPEIQMAYSRLHQLGWAHSIEVRHAETSALLGGLYGLHIAGFFAGESMFHWERDASKVALVELVSHLQSIGVVLLDVQWLTPHLASLGAVEIPRQTYLSLLGKALSVTGHPFTDPSSS